ncbi:hypothetical protein BC829DRAFT_390866 [Chytridium lagenaria]|nr:hypothetical protein BC829DRAFT_390866 [Chytridium lagenaria]
MTAPPSSPPLPGTGCSCPVVVCGCETGYVGGFYGYRMPYGYGYGIGIFVFSLFWISLFVWCAYG